MCSSTTIDPFEVDNYIQSQLSVLSGSLEKIAMSAASKCVGLALKDGLFFALSTEPLGKWNSTPAGDLFIGFSPCYDWFNGLAPECFSPLPVDLLQALKDQKEDGNFNDRDALLQVVSKFRACIDYIEANLPD